MAVKGCRAPLRPAAHCLLAGLLLPLGACTEMPRPDPLDPAGGALALMGVEHIVAVDTVERTGGMRFHFRILSTLSNRGNGPATLRVRRCLLVKEDIRPESSRVWAWGVGPRCADPDDSDARITLQPGESGETLTIMGTAPLGLPPAWHLSEWQLAVRHALEPEEWTPVTVRGPRRP